MHPHYPSNQLYRSQSDDCAYVPLQITNLIEFSQQEAYFYYDIYVFYLNEYQIDSGKSFWKFKLSKHL